MKIAFLDPIHWDYVVETPRLKPLGGSQSALCYLAEELARLGHDVTLMNATTAPGRSRGVECLRINGVPASRYAEFDVLIAMNWASQKFARKVRAAMRDGACLVLWSQHNQDQPAVAELADREAQESWDEFVLVSDWQAKGYREVFGLDPARIKILGNAIGPAFQNLYPEPRAVAAQKPWPPVLCYTSTPFRGLDVLLKAFPRIRAAIPGTRLRVFASMSVYGMGAEQDPFAALYAQCRATEGVEYVGSLPQVALAEALRGATCLAYPNTFAEGFCIAVLEAMAAGCVVITSDLGALRDTTAGFGHLLVPHPDRDKHAELYAEYAVRVLKEFHASPEAQALLGEQVLAVNRTGTWPVRARQWEAWLGSVVEKRKALQSVPPPSLEEAAAHYRAGRPREAEAICQAVLGRNPAHPEALHWLSLIALDAGDHQLAAARAQRAIEAVPAKSVLHHNLGEALRRLGRGEEALRSFRQAVALKPGFGQAHFSLGSMLAEMGDLDEAIHHLRRATAIQPEYAEALNNLGNALLAKGRTDEAIASFREALECRPGFPDALNNLGHVLAGEGKLDEGIACLREALAAAPGFAAAHNNLGTALLACGKSKPAKEEFERALACDPAPPVALGNLGAVLQEEGQLDEAIARYREALQKSSAVPQVWVNLAGALAEQGRRSEARDAFAQAVAAGASDAVRVLAACVVPPIAASKDELLEVRRSVAEGLAELAKRQLAIRDPAREVSSMPFYLPYQGLNDRDLLQALARIYEKASPSLAYRAPHCDAAGPSPVGRKIRLGFVSRRIGRQSVARVLMSGLIGRLSRERFAVEVFSFPHARNQDLEQMKACADRVVLLPPVLQAARARLAEERLDVLVYVDIGMDPLTYFLAFARLAPVQCATWQHPVTTGIPTVDYFVSSALFEPEGAEAHYSERLVRLESLPLWYERPRTPAPLKPRAALGLRRA